MTSLVTEFKVYTGANAATESPSGSATNLNVQSIDAYDSTNTDFMSNLIANPTTGTNYSYERIWRMKFTGTFNLIDNIKVYVSSGQLTDANMALNAGITTTPSTPVFTASSVAITAIPTTSGTALEPTPAGGITNSPSYSDYIYMQLKVPSSVTVIGSIGVLTISVEYNIQ